MLADALATYSRDRLKELCRELGLDDGGREKAQPRRAPDRDQRQGRADHGRKVYKAKVIGKSGPDTPVNHDVWVVAHPNDTNGNIFMTQPADVIRHEPGQPRTQGESTGGEATGGSATKTAAERGVPKAALTPTESKRKQSLMNDWRELDEKDLRDLVKLRERSGEVTYDPETPEHKLNAWENTQSDKKFPTWSAIYHRNIKNSKSGLGREADLRAKLDNGNGQIVSRRIVTDRGDRQVDAATPRVYIQLKAGDADLTRERQGGQLSNLEAIQRDRLADKPVVWVVEGKASQPLRDMLKGIDPPDVKLTGPQGPKTPLELFEGEGAFDAVVAKYGLPPKKDGK